MTRTSAKFPGELGRRELVRGAAGALLLCLGCGGREGAGRGGDTPRVRGAPPRTAALRTPRVPAEALRKLRDPAAPVALWSWFDLPFSDGRSHELSGIAWEDATRTLHAVQDENSRVVQLAPDAELRTWRIEGAVKLDVGDPVDLEGIVLLPDGFYVCSEIGPHIFEVDRSGKLRRDVPLPAHYATARRNKSLESLTMSPSGAYLFTTSEAALGCDGLLATLTTGTRIRIARLDPRSGDLTEHVYATDPVDATDEDYGVSEIAALSDDELLVLERGFMTGVGNSARIYRTRLASAAVCTSAQHVDDASTALPKQLFVDLGRLPIEGEPPPVRQPEPSPLLDNFECLAIGPMLPDGRASLIVASDDNGRPKQVARIVVLAVG